MVVVAGEMIHVQTTSQQYCDPAPHPSPTVFPSASSRPFPTSNFLVASSRGLRTVFQAAMAAPQSPSKRTAELKVPLTPPPQIHARDNQRPITPNNFANHNGWISPAQTPQGSPSKKQLPPGAYDLPNVFTNALKLNPTSGNGFRSPDAHSPTRGRAPLSEEKSDFRQSVIQQDKRPATGSPTRNKENTPPVASRFGFDAASQKQSSAATSRQDLYRNKDSHHDAVARSFPRLPVDQLEKLQKPAVKRLANVTQLCECLSRTMYGRNQC